MDEAAIESHGMAALKPHLAEIAAIHTQRELAHALGLTLRADVDALNATNFHTSNIFGLWVAPSFNDPDHYAPYLLQGGGELPDRDYYLADSDSMKDIRAKYQTHIAAMFRLAGLSDPEARAIRILALETAIAKAANLTRRQTKTFTKQTTPGTPPTSPLKPPASTGPSSSAPPASEKQQHLHRLAAHRLHRRSRSRSLPAHRRLERPPRLPPHRGPRHRASPKPSPTSASPSSPPRSTGTPQPRPRDIRADSFVSATLGDAVGQIYAKRFFSPEAKAQAEAIVANLIAAFRVRLENITWMAPATKKEAITKLSTLKVSVGYPDHWRSYSGYEVKPDNLFANLWNASLFEYHYSLSRIGKPVDRSEWCMEPQTVNAVNLPLDNGLNFPAAILQPPFFDPKAPAAHNYGAIGTVIGHEISHTFDSEGAAFDSRAASATGGPPKTSPHFETVTAALAAQYDTYEPFPGLHVKGSRSSAKASPT